MFGRGTKQGDPACIPNSDWLVSCHVTATCPPITAREKHQSRRSYRDWFQSMSRDFISGTNQSAPQHALPLTSS